MKLDSKLLIVCLGAFLSLGACAGDFSPVIDTSGSNTDTVGVMSTTGEDSGSSTGEGSTTGDSSTTGEGSGGSGGAETGGTTMGPDAGGTGDPPMENPGPGDPCHPLLAADGTAPCEDPNQNPDDVWTYYTCDKIVNYQTVEWKCVEFNGKYFGYSWEDPRPGSAGETQGDKCPSIPFGGCMNSVCVSNGLQGGGMYQNFPVGYCDQPQAEYPEDSNTAILPTHCCLPYCDDNHPCPDGFTSCYPLESAPFGNNFGACFFQN